MKMYIAIVFNNYFVNLRIFLFSSNYFIITFLLYYILYDRVQTCLNVVGDDLHNDLSRYWRNWNKDWDNLMTEFDAHVSGLVRASRANPRAPRVRKPTVSEWLRVRTAEKPVSMEEKVVGRGINKTVREYKRMTCNGILFRTTARERSYGEMTTKNDVVRVNVQETGPDGAEKTVIHTGLLNRIMKHSSFGSTDVILEVSWFVNYEACDASQIDRVVTDVRKMYSGDRYVSAFSVLLTNPIIAEDGRVTATSGKWRKFKGATIFGVIDLNKRYV